MKYSLGSLLVGTAIVLVSPSVAFAQDQHNAESQAAVDAADSGVDSAPARDDQQAGKDDIVVIGSHIQGANPNGLLPVTNIDEDEIAATGAESGDELFRNVAEAGDVGFNETRISGNLTDSRGDVASINIRNLGTGNTLVLLDGRRMVKHPGAQVENLVRVQTVNINQIPVSAIRRVEILRDGAAAIYGADAVAGVVNIVLDRKFEGLKLYGRYGFSEGTGFHRFSTNFKWGKSFNGGRTHIGLFGSYYTATPLRSDERSYSQSSDQRPRVEGTPFEGDSNFDLRSNTNAWAWLALVDPHTVRQGTTALTNSYGQFHIIPVENGCSGSSILDGGNCIRTGLQSSTRDRNLWWNENGQRWIYGARDRYSFFGTFDHEFSNDLKAFAEVNYYRADYRGLRKRAGTTSTSMIRIPSYNYWNPFGPITFPDGSPNPNRLAGLTLDTVPAEGLDVYLRTYTPVDVGPRPYTVKDRAYRFVAGLNGRVGGFDWETGAVYSEADKRDISHKEISKTLFQKALARSTPDAYNPFNGATVPGGPDLLPSSDLTSFLVSNTRASKSSLASLDARLSRPDLLQVPGGPVGIAVGAEWRRETYSDDRGDRINGTIKFQDMFGRSDGNSDSDIMGSQPLPNTAANRQVASAYAELEVPLVSPAMRMPLIHAIDLQLAARTEHYSDFGWITKPKVAASWEIIPHLMIRGSWSQSFRAPDLAQVSNADSQASSGYQDYYRCEADKRAGRIPNFGVCARSTSLTNYRSNADLLAEDAETFSYGVVIQPQLPSGWGRLTLTADYWRVHQINSIGLFGAGNQIALDYLLRMRGSSNPAVVRDEVTPEQLATFAGTGLEPVGSIVEVHDSFMNLQPETIEGLDLALRYDVQRTPLGNFSVRVRAAHLLKYDQEPSAMAQELLDAQASGEIDPVFLVTGNGNLLRQNGRPRWRVTSSLTWRKGPVIAGMSARYISSVEQTGARLADLTLWQVDGWTTVNAYVGYDFKHGPVKGTSVRLGVNNIANRAPPLAASDFGFLGSLHNAIGRYFYGSLSKSF